VCNNRPVNIIIIIIIVVLIVSIVVSIIIVGSVLCRLSICVVVCLWLCAVFGRSLFHRMVVYLFLFALSLSPSSEFTRMP